MDDDPDDPGHDEPVDRTDELAATVGLSAVEFAALLGASWTEVPGPVPHDYDADPSGGLDADPTPWSTSGAPPQLMVRVFPHGVFVATPRGYWAHGTHGLRYEPADQHYVASYDLATPATAELVARMVRRRRRSFRWCRWCRRSTPPELLLGDACMGCASTWEGVVY